MGLKKIGKGLVRPIVKEAQRGLRHVPAALPVVLPAALPAAIPAVLPVVLPAILPVVGRRKCTSSHVQEDFQQESITLVVTTGGEVEIQEVTSPCPDGNHDIVPCEQPLEIQLNDGSFVFNDKFCTKCGQHFPFLQTEAEAEIAQ